MPTTEASGDQYTIACVRIHTTESYVTLRHDFSRVTYTSHVAKTYLLQERAGEQRTHHPSNTGMPLHHGPGQTNMPYTLIGIGTNPALDSFHPAGSQDGAGSGPPPGREVYAYSSEPAMIIANNAGVTAMSSARPLPNGGGQAHTVPCPVHGYAHNPRRYSPGGTQGSVTMERFLVEQGPWSPSAAFVGLSMNEHPSERGCTCGR